MDKTIEIIMVIAVTIVVAGIIIFLVQGESGEFGEWTGDQGEVAQCEYYIATNDCDTFSEEQCDDVVYEDCEEDNGDTEEPDD